MNGKHSGGLPKPVHFLEPAGDLVPTGSHCGRHLNWTAGEVAQRAEETPSREYMKKHRDAELKRFNDWMRKVSEERRQDRK